MGEMREVENGVTRRGFLAGAAAAAGAYAFDPAKAAGSSPSAKVRVADSTINGVKLGIIAPYAFRGEATTAEEILEGMVQLGLSWVELQDSPIERFAGAPRNEGGRGGRGRSRAELTPEQRAERRADRERAAAALREWRLAQSMERFRELRRMYEDRGITISVVKFGLGPNMSDDETEYAFEVAKAVGAQFITCEPPVSDLKRLAEFANRHKIMVTPHGHANVTDVEAFGRPGAWEQAFYYSPFIGANIDIGHFTAGNSDPQLTIDTVREFAPRMSNIHVKDRRVDDGPNVPWGEGDTPIRQVLQMMRDERMPFMATIELEYPTPAGSTVMAELGKCIEYAKSALNETARTP